MSVFHSISLYKKLSNHGIPKGKLIYTPIKITSYSEIKQFLNFLQPTQETQSYLKKFNLPSNFLKSHKLYLFGYILGVLIGDATKTRTSQRSMFTDHSLSQKHLTNVRFGEFFSLCVNSIGIKMWKRRDKKRGHLYQYRWTSESSPHLLYIFEKMLGMDSDKLTTYDSINAEWIKNADRELKIGFVQGVFDSDGSKIHLMGRYLRVYTYPNSEFLQYLLIDLIGDSEGIKLREIWKNGQRLKIVWIRNINNIKKLFQLPVFSHYVNSYRYQLLKAFVQATTFQKATPLLKAKIREEITQKLLRDEGYQSIAESILFSYNIRFNKDVIDTIKKHLREKDGAYSRKRNTVA